MAKISTIAEKWDFVVGVVWDGEVPAYVSDKEARRAFYAGVAAMLDIGNNEIGEIQDDDEAVAELEKLIAEVREFSARIGVGQA